MPLYGTDISTFLCIQHNDKCKFRKEKYLLLCLVTHFLQYSECVTERLGCKIHPMIHCYLILHKLKVICVRFDGQIDNVNQIYSASDASSR